MTGKLTTNFEEETGETFTINGHTFPARMVLILHGKISYF
jgi:hypothetical protein